MKKLTITQFGNPLLHQKSKSLNDAQVTSKKIHTLIAEMRHLLISKKLGIGLAAPQVGRNLALAVVAIHPTPHRPKVKRFNLVLINPEITRTMGQRKLMWEGCISSGPGKAGLFAKVPRYEQLKVKYLDESATPHHKIFKDLPAQVIQHEVDHLNGVLFVDHVKDPKTFMTYSEYKKRVAKIHPR